MKIVFNLKKKPIILQRDISTFQKWYYSRKDTATFTDLASMIRHIKNIRDCEK